MVISRLWGGLGNQLFQYAYAYSIARENKCDLKLDARFFEKDYILKNRHFVPQKFNILELPLVYNAIITKKERLKIVTIFQNRYINLLIRIPSRFFFRIKKDYKYLKETRYFYDNKNIYIRYKNIYIDGYWQCEEYFKKYRDELIQQYVVRNEKINNCILENCIDSNESIAIHIRRGDYINNKNPFSNLYLLNENYYFNAISAIEKRVKRPCYYIFTNDYEWVTEKFKNIKNCIIVNKDRKLSDIEEFQVMSLCKHQIISNSTFSWWAAWLNQNNKKIVIAPNRWFGNRNIIPNSWEKCNIKG